MRERLLLTPAFAAVTALAALSPLALGGCKAALGAGGGQDGVEDNGGSGVEAPDDGASDPDASGEAPTEAELRAEAERREQAAEVDAAARRIILEVAKARELPVKGDFSVELVDKQGVRDFVEAVMVEEMSHEELALMGRINASLGVIPVGSDFEQVLLDMYELGVLGIYDPKRKTLMIGDYIDRVQLGMVVGHEGAHGLQDMHFDLEALNHMHKGRSDLDSAQTFLIEGDAQAAYLAWVAGDEGLASIGEDLLELQANMVLQIREDMGIPHTILARQMQMPYTDGTANVVRIARDQGWDAVNELYAELPTSSEQMLHLDKLAKREQPRPITVDSVPLRAMFPDHQPVWEDELGEVSLLAMLAEVATPGKAREAAAGWGGDRYVVLETKDQTRRAPAPLLAGVTAWDSVEDAKQFEALFRTYLQARKPDAFHLERKRDRVLYLTHFDAPAASLPEPERAKAVSKAAWSTFTVGSQPK